MHPASSAEPRASMLTARAAVACLHQRRPASGHLPAGQARTLIDAASAFDNGYTLALAAGSAFTYRYLKRQPPTPTEQARHPEPVSHQ